MPERTRSRVDRTKVRTAVVWEVLRRHLAQQESQGSGRLDVLDAGGGTGGFAVPMAALGHDLVVVDPSPDALAALQRRVAEAGVADRVRAVQGDAVGLLDVVAQGSADLVLCHGVLEYVDDPAEALLVMARVLRPGGTLSVLAANRSAAVLARAVAGRFADAQALLDGPQLRPRRFDAGELLRLLVGAGFEPGAVHGVRIFVDLVPESLVDTDAAEALLELERTAAEQPDFLSVATQLHVLASLRPTAD